MFLLVCGFVFKFFFNILNEQSNVLNYLLNDKKAGWEIWHF